MLGNRGARNPIVAVVAESITTGGCVMRVCERIRGALVGGPGVDGAIFLVDVVVKFVPKGKCLQVGRVACPDPYGFSVEAGTNFGVGVSARFRGFMPCETV